MPNEQLLIAGIFGEDAGNNSHPGLSLRKFPQGKSSSPQSLNSRSPRCVGTGLRLFCGEVLPEEFGGGFEKVVGGDDAD